MIIWGNCNDRTLRPKPGIMVNKGNHPQMAARFSLVKYYNLPRSMDLFKGKFTDFTGTPLWENRYAFL